jgi:uncharacterized membrane protein
MADFVGILLSALAAIIFGLSTVMQKYALKKVKKFSILALLHNRLWLSSVVFGSLGMLCYLAAILLYTVSSVQSIITASAVIPVLAGAFIFKEKLGVVKWLSIALVIIGIIVVTS